MESLDYWRLCDHVSVVQAALLIVGVNPAGTEEYIAGWEPHHIPEGFTAIYAALQGAILSGGLKASIRGDQRQIVLDAPFGSVARFEENGVQALYNVRPDWYGNLIEFRLCANGELGHNRRRCEDPRRIHTPF